MIKAIFFDMGGVAVNMVVPQINTRVKEIFQIDNFGLLSKDDFVATLLHLIETNNIDEKEFWTRFAKKHNKPLPNNWHSIFSDALLVSRFRPKIKQIIRELKSQGYIVSALSNVSEPFARRHYSLKHYEIFDHVFLSHEIGIRKPDTGIYLHALKTVAVQPHESIFVDDNISYVESAKKLGIHSILYKNPHHLKISLDKIISS